MKKLQLIACIAVLSLCLSSCEEDNLNFTDSNRYVTNFDNNMTGAQQIPANTSTATGKIEGTYDRKTKLFSYTITWANLSSNIVSNGIHIHGIADRGYSAIPVAPLAAYPNGIVQVVPTSTTVKTGSFSSTLYVDGVAVKEADLLSSKFYVDIHTVNFPNGEIRGQIMFP
jgi:hypothetical protein